MVPTRTFPLFSCGSRRLSSKLASLSESISEAINGSTRLSGESGFGSEAVTDVWSR